MDLKDYNDVTIYLLPLIKGIEFEDIDKETGFIMSFTSDTNRPYMENMIHLMYEPKTSEKALKSYVKLSNMESLHSKRSVIINSKHYSIFSFTIENKKALINLSSGKKADAVSASKIYSFWIKQSHDLPNEFIYKLFYSNYQIGKEIKEELPEEDYYPNEMEEYENRKSLPVNSDRLSCFKKHQYI